MSEPETIRINNVEYIRKDQAPQPAISTDGLPYVIVRSYRQGVMSGYLKQREGRVVTLLRARQLWSWRSKFCLVELSESGPVPEGCKFSCEKSQPMEMLEACAVYRCTETARDGLLAVPAQEK